MGASLVKIRVIPIQGIYFGMCIIRKIRLSCIYLKSPFKIGCIHLILRILIRNKELFRLLDQGRTNRT